MSACAKKRWNPFWLSREAVLKSLGDIVRARNGRTIEILNTDAEGRLVLADALSNSSELLGQLQTAAKETGEKVWALPFDEEFLKDMEGTWSDLANIGKKSGAGSAQAAMFLSQFVKPEVPWLHLDTAGTAQHVGGRLPYAPIKGASGAMVRTLVQLATNFAECEPVFSDTTLLCARA